MGIIKVLIIYEILGKPKEHIKDSLDQLIIEIGKNKGIKIITKKIHEPHPIEENKLNELKAQNIEGVETIFTTFAEVEMEIDSLELVFTLVINTLPSNIEIIEPTDFKLNNFLVNSLLNNITIKMHKYDELAKGFIFERNQLIKKLKELKIKHD